MTKIVDKIKKAIAALHGKELYVALALIALLAFICFFGKGNGLFSFAAKSSDGSAAVGAKESYCDKMSDEILSAVKMICGSDNCKVIINWQEGEQDILAYVVKTDKNGETKTPQLVTVNGVSSPLVIGKTQPKAKSLAIVCPKSTSTTQKLDIKYLVSTLLGCDFDQIAIYDC